MARYDLYGFDEFLERLDTLTALYNTPLPTQQSNSNNSSDELLNFNVFLSRRDTSVSPNNETQVQQSNSNSNSNNTVASLTSRCPPQETTMAHWRGNGNVLPTHLNTLLDGQFPESNIRATPLTGVINDRNSNHTTTSVNNHNFAASESRSAAAEIEAIFDFLDNLDNIEPPIAETMSNRFVYGTRPSVASGSGARRNRNPWGHAMRRVIDIDEEEDVIPVPNNSSGNTNHRYPTSAVRDYDDDDEDEEILDCIMVSSEVSSQAPPQNQTDSDRPDAMGAKTAGTSPQNYIAISSDSETHSEDRQSSSSTGNDDDNGDDDYQGENAPSSSLSNAREIISLSSSSDGDTEIQEDGGDQQKKEESVTPAPSPGPPPQPQPQPQLPKFYYFATGAHMDKKVMKQEYPDAKPLGLALLKGYRWLICGPRRSDPEAVRAQLAVSSFNRHNTPGPDPAVSSTTTTNPDGGGGGGGDNNPQPGNTTTTTVHQDDVFSGGRDPEGYATIAPVYKSDDDDNNNNDGNDDTTHHHHELDTEGSWVYGILYEVTEAESRALTAATLQWEYSVATVAVTPLTGDITSVEPEFAATLPLLLKPAYKNQPLPLHACTYLVDGARWHIPWRAPSPRSGGRMELGRLRDHERPLMIPYMRRYNADWPPLPPPYPVPPFAARRRDDAPACPQGAGDDDQPRVYRQAYMDGLRDVFHAMLFDRETPLWYVNEVLRPWVRDLEWWPQPH